MKFKKMFSIIVIMLVCINILGSIGTTIFAEGTSEEDSTDWWGKAFTFFEEAKKVEKVEGVTEPLDDLKKFIILIGNAVIIICTMFLGIKYMYGSSEGKAQVKDGLITLVIAMTFFYGWTSITEILMPDNQLIFFNKDKNATVSSIYSTILYFANFISIGVIIYVGIKYLAAGAEGKAELKGKGVPFIIGMVMTFATLTFLQMITNTLNDIL